MGAYLSKPKTEMTSSVYSNETMSCGASAMQGWRVSMEDAHTCVMDFDKNTSLFAVFDGHGGSEVALYAEKHLGDVLKTTEGYKNGKAKQGLKEAFLKLDEDIVTEQGLKELKEIAGETGDDSEEENEADLLAQDAAIPLKELLSKLKGDIYKLEKEKKNPDDENDDEEDEMEENEEVTANGDAKDKHAKNTEPESEEKEMKNGKESSDKRESPKNGESKVAEEKHDIKEDEKSDDESEEEEEADDDDDDDDDDETNEDKEDDSNDDDDGDENDEDDDDDEADGMQNKSDEVGYDSGTTAIVAMVKDDVLTVANAGDSRCVLCRNGIALEMSIDHKPEDAKELNRIQKAGGKVTGEGRVNGGLNLSRAIGDHSYKGRTELTAEEQQITAMPDVRQTQLTEDDEFMVIACDGIWNVMNSQEVVDFVKDELKGQRNGDDVNLSKICEKLFEACLAPDTSGDGSGCDNMTCVIVTFDKLGSAKAGKRKSPEHDDITHPDKKSRTDKE